MRLNLLGVKPTVSYEYLDFDRRPVLDALPSLSVDLVVQSLAHSIGIKEELDMKVFLDKDGEGSFSTDLILDVEAFQWINGKKQDYSSFDPPFVLTTSNDAGMSNTSFKYKTPSFLPWDINEPLINKASCAGEKMKSDSIFLNLKN